jgi:hypothetical protein
VHKPWKTIVGLALLGLALAALSYVYAAFYDYTKPMNRLDFAFVFISIVLCPPQLLLRPQNKKAMFRRNIALLSFIALVS